MLSGGEVFCAHWFNNVGIFIIEMFLGQILQKKKKERKENRVIQQASKWSTLQMGLKTVCNCSLAPECKV